MRTYKTLSYILVFCLLGFTSEQAFSETPTPSEEDYLIQDTAPDIQRRGRINQDVSEADRKELENLIRKARARQRRDIENSQGLKTKEAGLLDFGDVRDKVYHTAAGPSYDTVNKKKEDWKGDPARNDWNAGALIGLTIFDGRAGFAFLGSLARKIVHQGFIPDINNQVFLEAHAGPLFIEGSSAFFSSLHLRWDFQKNEDWRLYAVGGVGSHVTGAELGDAFRVFPRIGIGAMVNLTPVLAIRSELSQENILIGTHFAF